MIHVVIIDDEEQITTMLKRILLKNGEITVTTFNNPVNALERLTALKPDVVLLDIMMPQMDGVEVLTRIKRDHPEVRVIMMTAYSTLDRVLACHKLGAENYLQKPFDNLRDVERAVMELLTQGAKSK